MRSVVVFGFNFLAGMSLPYVFPGRSLGFYIVCVLLCAATISVLDIATRSTPPQ